MYPPAIRKFERTPHLQGSRHQLDDDPTDLPLKHLFDRYIVAEEKLDGANCAARFAPSGELLLQSRGHYLTGSARERHFDMFKAWGNAHAARFREVLGTRYVMYGEWLYAKHTVFYDMLPAYFMEFDVYDLERSCYLSTRARRELLRGLPIVPVPVLSRGIFTRGQSIAELVRPSLYRSPNWQDALMAAARESRSREDMVLAQSDMSELSEGVYGKIEHGDQAIGRFKFVRSDFLQTIQSSDSHWHDRPILPNTLAPGIDIFAWETGVPGAYDDPEAPFDAAPDDAQKGLRA